MTEHARHYVRSGFAGALALAAIQLATAASAADYDVGSIHITQPWARATPKGASSGAGYLTVSEIFPVEMRGLAIALFFSLGTAVAALSPEMFASLIESGNNQRIFLGYLIGSLVMVADAAVEWCFGIDTEQKSLEDVASPLTAV